MGGPLGKCAPHPSVRTSNPHPPNPKSPPVHCCHGIMSDPKERWKAAGVKPHASTVSGNRNTVHMLEATTEKGSEDGSNNNNKAYAHVAITVDEVPAKTHKAIKKVLETYAKKKDGNLAAAAGRVGNQVAFTLQDSTGAFPPNELCLYLSMVNSVFDEDAKKMVKYPWVNIKNSGMEPMDKHEAIIFMALFEAVKKTFNKELAKDVRLHPTALAEWKTLSNKWAPFSHHVASRLRTKAPFNSKG